MRIAWEDCAVHLGGELELETKKITRLPAHCIRMGCTKVVRIVRFSEARLFFSTRRTSNG